MPTYRYDGEIPFISIDYNIIAHPGDTITTSHILPQSWSDFTLLDASDVNALTPSTMPVTLPIGANIVIPVEGYDNVSVIKIGGDGVVEVTIIDSTHAPGTKAVIGTGITGLRFNLSGPKQANEISLKAPSSNLESVEVLVLRGTFDTEPLLVGSGSGSGGGGVPSNENMTSRIEYVDASSTDPLYVGYAPPGSSESDPVWQIRKMEYDGANRLIAVKFAEGELAYNKVWANRASYSYS